MCGVSTPSFISSWRGWRGPSGWPRRRRLPSSRRLGRLGRALVLSMIRSPVLLDRGPATLPEVLGPDTSTNRDRARPMVDRMPNAMITAPPEASDLPFLSLAAAPLVMDARGAKELARACEPSRADRGRRDSGPMSPRLAPPRARRRGRGSDRPRRRRASVGAEAPATARPDYPLDELRRVYRRQRARPLALVQAALPTSPPAPGPRHPSARPGACSWRGVLEGRAQQLAAFWLPSTRTSRLHGGPRRHRTRMHRIQARTSRPPTGEHAGCAS